MAFRHFPAWVILGGLLIPLAYLPTLGTRFDFIDDGNLVYPMAPMPFTERIAAVGDKIAANYDHLGPFRPVLWVHWELEAELFQGDAFAWRLARLAWCMFAATTLLWLLAELKIPGPAALAATALAMWNPYRNEIWTSLTLSEGVAMPYALLALVCAIRARASRHSFAWDLLGMACVLAALGCKNTFAALVPVQMFLRIAEEGLSLREGWRQHGRRAVLLSITLIAPAIHFVYFKLHWHPGQYQPGGPSIEQARRLASSLSGAMSLDFLGVGIGLMLWAIRLSGASFRSYRTAIVAGTLLLLGGVAMYLPMDAMSGRYTMPAVWGLDIMLAVLFAMLFSLPWTFLKRAAVTALVIGFAAVFAAGIGKQLKFAARANLLWQSLEWVEQNAPPGSTIAWLSNDAKVPGLNVEEGIHFQWHLLARGRGDLKIVLQNGEGLPLSRVELTDNLQPAQFALWDGHREPLGAQAYELKQDWITTYWFGQKRSQICWGQASP